MEQAIKKISSQYPPGKGLDENQKELKETLTNMKYEDKFNYKSHELESKNNRSERLE